MGTGVMPPSCHQSETATARVGKGGDSADDVLDLGAENRTDGAGPDQPEKESPADRPEVISHTTGDATGRVDCRPEAHGPGRPSSAPQMGVDQLDEV